MKDVMNREEPHRRWRWHVQYLQRGISVLERTVCVSCTVVVITWFVTCGVCTCGVCNVWCV